MSSLRSVEGHSALPLFSFEFRATQSINTKAHFFLLAGLVVDDGIKKGRNLLIKIVMSVKRKLRLTVA